MSRTINEAPETHQASSGPLADYERETRRAAADVAIDVSLSRFRRSGLPPSQAAIVVPFSARVRCARRAGTFFASSRG